MITSRFNLRVLIENVNGQKVKRQRRGIVSRDGQKYKSCRVDNEQSYSTFNVYEKIIHIVIIHHQT